MDTLLAVEQVTKHFGVHKALSKVSLEIPENAIYGLLGPNGAGKTTLIRIINQITYPDQGQVFFGGEALQQHHIAQIGYLPEERGLYKSMKVGEQALYLAQLKGMGKADAKKKLKYWFERLEIGDWWGKKVQELSKGMAQKIQFIVTVLHQPKLIIFDEPFSGFDPINANIIKDEILRLRDQGTTVIFSTHRMESVEELCEYIALIHKSEKILDGKLSAIKKAYKTNTFRISVAPDAGAGLIEALPTEYKISNVVHDPAEGTFDFTVQLKDTATTALLAQIGKNGNVLNFRELVPSANDIFIAAVNGKSGVHA